jgi:hypothetical protein
MTGHLVLDWRLLRRTVQEITARRTIARSMTIP